MKFLIVGANGLIASHIAGSNFITNHIFTSSSTRNRSHVSLDLGDPDAFDYSVVDADTMVLLLASISSPDQCANQYEYSYSINVIGTCRFIKRCLNKNAKVLFFSTDAVYGHADLIVNEESIASPYGDYAAMKFAVEQAFIHHDNFKVFRLSYVYAFNDKFTRYLKSCHGCSIDVFDDFKRAIIFIEDLLYAVNEVSNSWAAFTNSVYNLCGPELLSRKEFVDYFLDIGLGDFAVNSVPAPTEFYENRPRSINCESLYIADLLGRPPTNIRDALMSDLKKGML